MSKTFLSRVFDRNRGFAHLRVRDIIAHLFTWYGQVEYQDLMGNLSKLSEQWDARKYNSLQTMEDVRSPTKISLTTYTIWYTTRAFFYDDWDKWDNRQLDKKTWANFQAHFQAAQQEFKSKQKVSTRAGGYHGANNLWEMDGKHDSLINLVTAHAADRETMMSQCKTIANLIATVATLTQQLQQVNTVNNRGSVIPVER